MNEGPASSTRSALRAALVRVVQALHGLRDDISAMYSHADAESARIRGAQLNAVVRLTPFMMLANIGNGALVLWTFSAAMPQGLWVWWSVLMVASLLALANWLRRRGHALGDAAPVASRRAVQRATWHAVVLGGIWAAMPALWFGAATPSQQLIVATLVAGMLGAGTFVLHPLPRASLSYAFIVYTGALWALWSSGNGMFIAVAVLLSFYTPVVVLGALFTWRKATRLLRSQAEAVRQERMLAVLLHDFEEDADEALWETDPAGRLNHLSPRLAQLLGVTESQAREQSLLPLLAARCCDGALALQRAFEAGRGFRGLTLVLADGPATRPAPGRRTGRHVRLAGCAGRHQRQGAQRTASAPTRTHRFFDRAGQPLHAARGAGGSAWRRDARPGLVEHRPRPLQVGQRQPGPHRR
jgi:PAS domain-containing protein